MDVSTEKTIIEGKQSKIVKAIPLIVAVVGTILMALIKVIEVYARWDRTSRYTGQYTVGQMLSWTRWEDLIIVFVVLLVIGFVIAKAFTASITITNKRVFGTTGFGKRVDLPLDSISAIGTSAMNGVAITTSSGVIKFSFMENAKELHRVVGNLLIERQEKRN